MQLCLNIDHVATLRQARGGPEPSVLEFAKLAEEAGADGITVHLREDRRHIQDEDVFALREIVRGNFTLEMAATEEMLLIAKQVKPDLLTIVPEKRQELTTEGGLNLKNQYAHLLEFTKECQAYNLAVSFFIEPDRQIIDLAKQIGATRIELHTGSYAHNPNQAEIDKLKEAAFYASQQGLKVNAGHGLSLNNLKPILQIPELEELHIGYAILARALFVGAPTAIQEIKALLTSLKDSSEK
jgi:pyridoxine 5-phosphate synthase